MKIMSYNIYLTPVFSTDLRARQKNLINFLKTVDADVVCLQECFWGYKKLSSKLKDVFPYNSGRPPKSLWRPINSGLVVFSKKPIKNIKFNAYKNLNYPDFLASKGWLYCEIGDFKIVNTHLQACQSDNDISTRKKNILQLQNIYEENIIVCGDFNVDFWSEEKNFLVETLKLSSFNQIGEQKYSFDPNTNSLAIKSESEPFLFDYFLFDEKLKLNSLEVIIPEQIISDHYPVVSSVDA